MKLIELFYCFITDELVDLYRTILANQPLRQFLRFQAWKPKINNYFASKPSFSILVSVLVTQTSESLHQFPSF